MKSKDGGWRIEKITKKGEFDTPPGDVGKYAVLYDWFNNGTNFNTYELALAYFNKVARTPGHERTGPYGSKDMKVKDDTNFYQEGTLKGIGRSGTDILRDAEKYMSMARKNLQQGIVSNSYNFLYGDLMRMGYGGNGKNINPSQQRDLEKLVQEAKKMDIQNAKNRKAKTKDEFDIIQRVEGKRVVLSGLKDGSRKYIIKGLAEEPMTYHEAVQKATELVKAGKVTDRTMLTKDEAIKWKNRNKDTSYDEFKEKFLKPELDKMFKDKSYVSKFMTTKEWNEALKINSNRLTPMMEKFKRTVEENSKKTKDEEDVFMMDPKVKDAEISKEDMLYLKSQLRDPKSIADTIKVMKETGLDVKKAIWETGRRYAKKSGVAHPGNDPKSDKYVKDAAEVKKINSKIRYKGHEIREVLLKDGTTEYWVYTNGDPDFEASSMKEAKDFIDSY